VWFNDHSLGPFSYGKGEKGFATTPLYKKQKTMKKLIIAILIGTTLSAQPVEPIDSFALPPIPTLPQPEISVFIPNVITPNGDGINDRFELILQPNYKAVVEVYSRWGNLVYKSNNYQNDYLPTELSDGVYAFWVRIYDGNRYKDFQKMITIIN
jgi:gliding motility-associated-like protein|tara:strand:- start:89 stop:550 length:462 start_codon:yes stop_codon:yes gene_type:complete